MVRLPEGIQMGIENADVVSGMAPAGGGGTASAAAGTTAGTDAGSSADTIARANSASTGTGTATGNTDATKFSGTPDASNVIARSKPGNHASPVLHHVHEQSKSGLSAASATSFVELERSESHHDHSKNHASRNVHHTSHKLTPSDVHRQTLLAHDMLNNPSVHPSAHLNQADTIKPIHHHHHISDTRRGHSEHKLSKAHTIIDPRPNKEESGLKESKNIAKFNSDPNSNANSKLNPKATPVANSNSVPPFVDPSTTSFLDTNSLLGHDFSTALRDSVAQHLHICKSAVRVVNVRLVEYDKPGGGPNGVGTSTGGPMAIGKKNVDNSTDTTAGAFDAVFGDSDGNHQSVTGPVSNNQVQQQHNSHFNYNSPLSQKLNNRNPPLKSKTMMMQTPIANSGTQIPTMNSRGELVLQTPEQAAQDLFHDGGIVSAAGSPDSNTLSRYASGPGSNRESFLVNNENYNKVVGLRSTNFGTGPGFEDRNENDISAMNQISNSMNGTQVKMEHQKYVLLHGNDRQWYKVPPRNIKWDSYKGRYVYLGQQEPQVKRSSGRGRKGPHVSSMVSMSNSGNHDGAMVEAASDLLFTAPWKMYRRDDNAKNDPIDNHNHRDHNTHKISYIDTHKMGTGTTPDSTGGVAFNKILATVTPGAKPVGNRVNRNSAVRPNVVTDPITGVNLITNDNLHSSTGNNANTGSNAVSNRNTDLDFFNGESQLATEDPMLNSGTGGGVVDDGSEHAQQSLSQESEESHHHRELQYMREEEKKEHERRQRILNHEHHQIPQEHHLNHEHQIVPQQHLNHDQQHGHTDTHKNNHINQNHESHINPHHITPHLHHSSHSTHHNSESRDTDTGSSFIQVQDSDKSGNAAVSKLIKTKHKDDDNIDSKELDHKLAVDMLVSAVDNSNGENVVDDPVIVPYSALAVGEMEDTKEGESAALESLRNEIEDEALKKSRVSTSLIEHVAKKTTGKTSLQPNRSDILVQLRILDLEDSVDSMVDLRLGLMALRRYVFMSGLNQVFRDKVKDAVKGKVDVNIEELVEVDSVSRPAPDMSADEYSYCIEGELLFREKLRHQWKVLMFGILLSMMFSLSVSVNYCMVPLYARRRHADLLSEPPLLVLDELISSHGGSDDDENQDSNNVNNGADAQGGGGGGGANG